MKIYNFIFFIVLQTNMYNSNELNIKSEIYNILKSLSNKSTLKKSNLKHEYNINNNLNKTESKTLYETIYFQSWIKYSKFNTYDRNTPNSFMTNHKFNDSTQSRKEIFNEVRITLIYKFN